MQNNTVPSITAPGRNAPTSIGRSLSFRMISLLSGGRPTDQFGCRPHPTRKVSNAGFAKRETTRNSRHGQSVRQVWCSVHWLRPRRRHVAVADQGGLADQEDAETGGESGSSLYYLLTITSNGPGPPPGASLCPFFTQIAPQILSLPLPSSACTQDINPLPYPLTAMNCCA